MCSSYFKIDFRSKGLIKPKKRIEMKNWVGIGLLLFLMQLTISCNNEGAKKEVDKSKLQVVELEVAVDGMTCSGCESSVNTSLLKMDGVQDSKASHIDKKVIIKLDTNVTSIGEVKATISDIGYTIIKQ